MAGSLSDVVQAANFHGDVHFHGGAGRGEHVPRQLPGDIGGFVNRVPELDRLNEAFSGKTRVYVIAGTAGVGKTSLALHWAHSVRDQFPDGQLYVNLRGYDPGPQLSAEQALDQVLRALGVPPAGIPPDLEDKSGLYRTLLASKQVLVVLDNAATVGQVRPLLPGNTECLVLVTSRSMLSGLRARDGAQRINLDVLTEEEAVQLLRTVIADYRTHDDPAELVELARLCARLPLALRIAAERASSRPLMLLTELIADLVDESALWDALSAEGEEDADAVRSVFAWSYRALPQPAARLFRQLGLHPGAEFSLQAAAAIGGIPTGQARQLLDALVGAHMVEQRVRGRFQFHDLLRAYATDQAMRQETAEDRERILRRVLTWYLHTAANAMAVIGPLDRKIIAEAEPDASALSFSQYDEAFGWYERERTNLVAATYTAAQVGLHELAWQLPAVLWTVFSVQNPFEDWISTSLVGLEAVRHVGDRFGEGELLASLGMAYLQCERLDQADEYQQAALSVRRELADPIGTTMSITCIGLAAWRRRDLADALALFEEALQLQRQTGDRAGEAWSLSNVGMVYLDLDRVAEGAELLHASVGVCREVGDPTAEGNALCFLAMAQRELGLHDDALTTIQRALAIADEQSDPVGTGFWLLELARIQRAMHKPDEALTSYQRSAVVHRQLADRSREAMALDGTGEAYREIGVPSEAAKFHRLAVSAHRELKSRWNLATALANLAAALDDIGDTDQARIHWAEAAEILAEFDDPKARRLRDQITG